VIRRNERQQASTTEIAFVGGRAPNQPLRDADAVIVPSTEELQRTVLLIGAVTGAESLDQAATIKRLPFIVGDTVRTLIERAGGLRAQGDLRRAYISRPQNNAEPLIVPLDLEALLVRRDFSADRQIMIDDSIVVPPMRYSILVEGAVGRSGVYNYNPRFGVPEYIAIAGGRSRTAQDMSDVRLVDMNGLTRPYRKGMKPQPGDAILVPERNFTRAEVVQIVIATAGLLVSGVAITLAATR
jgi:protein involved in polysaccharide export with SLBB domain